MIHPIKTENPIRPTYMDLKNKNLYYPTGEIIPLKHKGNKRVIAYAPNKSKKAGF